MDAPADPQKKKLGRPSRFSDAVASQILSRVIQGESLPFICRDPDLPPYKTVANWLFSQDQEIKPFQEAYARAKEAQGEYFVEQLLAISDDDSKDEKTPIQVQRDRLKIDTRKWLASKLLPKKYGDQPQLVVSTHLHAHVSLDKQKELAARHALALGKVPALKDVPGEDTVVSHGEPLP